MKTLFTVLALTLASASLIPTVVHAQTSAAAHDLESVMKEIDAQYDTVKDAITHAGTNLTTVADAAAAMRAAIFEAIALTPDQAGGTHLSDLPAARRRVVTLQYLGLISQLFTESVTMEQALLANDRVKARDSLGRMTQLRQQGHQVFRP